jgi:hypothetical protein
LAPVLYDVALCAAFWVALAGDRGGREHAPRFLVGLALGALFARSAGLLFAPLGLLLAAPWPANEQRRFLDAALPVLPLAFATAKLGCLAAGCCAAAGAEALGFAAVAGACVRAPRPRAPALALAGIGGERLLALALRPEAALSALPATLWLALAALLCRPSRGDGRCPPLGNATSSRTAPSSRPGCAAGSAPRATSA